VSGLVGVVLAAGAGTRLRPLTELLPKALCPVDGVPLVDRAIERVTPHVDALAVNAHHHAQRLADHVRDRAYVSVEAPVALGTAGALGALRPWIDGRAVLVTNADAYLAGGLDALVAGWDGRCVRVLVHRDEARGDFGPDRYSGSCLLPWSVVPGWSPSRPACTRWCGARCGSAASWSSCGPTDAFVDCGTPSDYLRANLHASGGANVVGAGAVVEGSIERCVVWPAPGSSLASGWSRSSAHPG
jgi:CTP:molybdopterin cytidylyltransferase MocA